MNLNADVKRFFNSCVRTANHNQLGAQLYKILLKFYKKERKHLSSLAMLYANIGYTRDIIYGKGEYTLTYLQIYIWYYFYPDLAYHALNMLVKNTNGHSYGSWKDIKYFCEYVKNACRAYNHPLIYKACWILTDQLKIDVQHNYPISLAGKWCPREKKKHGWVFNIISQMFSPHIIQSAPNWTKRFSAQKKANMILRKELADLNYILATPQIYMCSNNWNDITSVSSNTLQKNRQALMRHDVKLKRINANRCEINKMVKSAGDIITDKQWEEHKKMNKPIKNHLAIINISPEFQEKNPVAFNTAIGLGIRISEMSTPVFKDHCLVFSGEVRWLYLKGSFGDKVKSIMGAQCGYHANIGYVWDFLKENFGKKKYNIVVLTDKNEKPSPSSIPSPLYWNFGNNARLLNLLTVKNHDSRSFEEKILTSSRYKEMTDYLRTFFT